MLMLASELGQSEVVDYLLGSNADVNICDNVCYSCVLITVVYDGVTSQFPPALNSINCYIDRRAKRR